MSTATGTRGLSIGRPASWMSRYGLAVMSVAAALLVMRALPADRQVRGPLFVPAILLSAWRGGIEVKDSGKGIDPAQRERSFDPFCSTKASGLGMGLAISRSIIEQHGGQIAAGATDGPGVAMRVTLPAMAAEVGSANG